MTTEIPAPAVLHGLRCGEPMHTGYGYGTVFCTSDCAHALAGLADGQPCNEVVVSDDGGRTWARVEP